MASYLQRPNVRIREYLDTETSQPWGKQAFSKWDIQNRFPDIFRGTTSERDKTLKLLFLGSDKLKERYMYSELYNTVLQNKHYWENNICLIIDIISRMITIYPKDYREEVTIKVMSSKDIATELIKHVFFEEHEIGAILKHPDIIAEFEITSNQGQVTFTVPNS